MSANPAVTPIGKVPALQPNQGFVSGRVQDVRRTENAVYTIIQSPAADAYSHPGQHLVISSRLLGKPGEDVEVKVVLGGYRRTYTDKHGDKVATVDNSLKAIED